MSQWTHVNGCIRLDGLPGIVPENTIENVCKLMGNCVSFNDESDLWDRCNVPCGSEGSLKYEVLEIDKGLVWLTIPIWGDLRDFHSIEEIRTWFEKIVLSENVMVRSAVLEVHIEYTATYVLYYQNSTGNGAVGCVTTWEYNKE